MPALRKTTAHESTVTYATGLVQHMSKTVYEIDVLDMGATETFHGLGSRDRHGDQVVTLLVTLTDTDPFERQPADGVHLTAEGQVRLGDGFYEALAAATRR